MYIDARILARYTEWTRRIYICVVCMSICCLYCVDVYICAYTYIYIYTRTADEVLFSVRV